MIFVQEVIKLQKFRLASLAVSLYILQFLHSKYALNSFIKIGPKIKAVELAQTHKQTDTQLLIFPGIFFLKDPRLYLGTEKIPARFARRLLFILLLCICTRTTKKSNLAQLSHSCPQNSGTGRKEPKWTGRWFLLAYKRSKLSARFARRHIFSLLFKLVMLKKIENCRARFARNTIRLYNAKINPLFA